MRGGMLHRTGRRKLGSRGNGNGLADEPLNVADIALLVRHREGNGMAFGPGARGAADAVHVILAL